MGFQNDKVWWWMISINLLLLSAILSNYVWGGFGIIGVITVCLIMWRIGLKTKTFLYKEKDYDEL